VLAAAPPPPIVIGHGMAGVELRMSEAQVRARLGAPTRVAGRLFHYPLLDVQFGATGVVRLTTTSPRLRTRSGLGVGSAVVRLQRLRGLFCNLVPGGGNCETKGIRFDFAHNRVTRVVVPG
jgi:hypothetical protein